MTIERDLCPDCGHVWHGHDCKITTFTPAWTSAGPCGCPGMARPVLVDELLRPTCAECGVNLGIGNNGGQVDACPMGCVPVREQEAS